MIIFDLPNDYEAWMKFKSQNGTQEWGEILTTQQAAYTKNITFTMRRENDPEQPNTTDAE